MAHSTFGERFGFARWWQSGYVLEETDADFAAALGRSKAWVSQLRGRDEPPSPPDTRAIAVRVGLDGGWLTHGTEAGAKDPPLFPLWLATYRKSKRSPREAAEPDGRLSAAMLPPTKAAAKKAGRRRRRH